jgi:hypothetical protein
MRLVFLLPVLAGLAKGGKGGGSYSAPAPAAAVAQNVSTEQDTASEVTKLASNAKKKGYWWTKLKDRDTGDTFSKGIVGK